jgi:hypothetical protein
VLNEQKAQRLRWFWLSLLFILTMLYYVGNHAIMLGDPDLWWHIVMGQGTINSGHVPTTDTYSYTFAGSPLIAKEWLSQVLLALAFNIGKWNAVLLLAAAAASTALALTYWELSRYINPIIACLLLLFVAYVLTPITIARPHIFTFATMVFFTIRMFRAAEELRVPEFWLLAIIVLWTNLHGSFTLSFAIAAFAFLYMLEKSKAKNISLIMKWVGFGILCLLASFLNPYGWEPLLVNRTLINGIKAMDFLVEWQPLNAQLNPLFEVAVLGAISLVWLAAPRLAFSKILFALFTLHMMLTHIRFLYVFFLLAPLVVVREIAAANANISFQSFTSAIRSGWEETVSKYLKPIAVALSAIAIALIAKFAPFSPPPDRNIAGAFEYIKSHNLNGPVFNEYNFGGPLIMQGVKTYIDGRADQLFQGAFFDDYISTYKAGNETTLARILATNKVTWTIFPPASQQNKWLATQSDWKKTYADDEAVIFEKVN